MYLHLFVSSATSVADRSDDRCDDIAGLMCRQVPSHTRLQPLAYGKLVIPSGRLPSPLSSPTGPNME